MAQLIAGNWKMNGLTATGRELAGALAAWMRDQKAPHFELLVCPPAPLLVPVAEAIAGSGIVLGAQDCHAEDSGAHTGDVSAALLADVGCRYVIVGHSERRADHGETSAEVHEKALAAHRAGLVPIVCVGETAAERAAGHALQVIRRQVEESVFEAGSDADLVVAYEPVWAIGTGNTATPADVAEAHGEIRGVLRALLHDKVGDGVRILYGGSVKPDNAAGLLVVPNVDGALVGGASLEAADFQAIAAAVPDAPHPAEDEGLQSV